MSWVRNHIIVEPPHSPPYVLENMAKVRPLRLVSVLGIDWMASPTACVAPVWIAAFGVAISFVFQVGSGAGERLLIGLVYGVLIGASVLVHQLGGAIAGKLVAAPMRSVIFTATLPYNVYDESREYPSRVHVIRSLGEPAANLLLGAAMLVLYVAGLDNHFVLFLAILNLAFFGIAMAPLPTMHGGVVLKHLKARE